MENATKALLISAAVLIAIVLIAVGIQILGSTSGAVNDVGEVSETMGQSVFNSQFTDYVGTQNGTHVKTLLSKASATYRASAKHKVEVNVKGGDGLTTGTYNTANDIATVMSQLKIKSNYTISVGYDNTTGYINKIIIK